VSQKAPKKSVASLGAHKLEAVHIRGPGDAERRRERGLFSFMLWPNYIATRARETHKLTQT